MNMPTSSVSKPRMHPMIIAACSAVVLVCAVGTAAIMGWIPTSAARNTEASSLVQPAPQNSVNDPVKAPVKAHAIATVPARNTPRLDSDNPRPIAAVCTTCGVVESTREITTAGQGSGVGAVGGAVVGGVLGHQVGGGRGKDVATVLGALGGAFAGNQIEGQVRGSRSFEITVRLDDGSLRTVHQTEQPGWQAGDRVKVVNGTLRSIS
ncbi:MAG: glycine zipper 2TM domain-containing protein [Ferruginibacter sp.]|nr:glycine zipper 2TM domain-containing protein [Rhodoferax sp.]